MRRKGRMAAGAAIVVALIFGSARGDTFTVADGDVAGLVAAITASNNNSVADTIELAPGGVYSLTAVADAGAGPTGLPGIRSMITINGHGAVIERGEGAPASLRIFRVQNTGKLTLNGVHVRGGVALSTSTGSLGGGVYLSGGSLTVNHSTFSGNTAVVGGAIYQLNGTVTINSSTISGNSAQQAGGIFSDGALNLSSATVTSNSASDRAGGIDASGLTSNKLVTLMNTLLAGNDAPSSPDVSVVGAVTSSGFNLVGDAGTSSGWAQSDLVGSAEEPIDPLLEPLALNGGLTPTHSPIFGSPAIDAVAPQTNGCGVTETSDQCGQPRPSGNGCDIGALEVQVVPPTAYCADVTVAAGAGCDSNVSAELVDDGSEVDPICGLSQLALSPAAPYPVGDTAVTLTVTDGCGQTATCTATVTVLPPASGTCPEDMVLLPTMPSGAVYAFEAVGDGDCDTQATCSIETCGVLPMGTTTLVTCGEGDGACTFTINVYDLANGTLKLQKDTMNVLQGHGLGFEKLLVYLKLTLARMHFEWGQDQAGCAKLEQYIQALNSHVADGDLSAEEVAPLQETAEGLINAACGADPADLEDLINCADDEDGGGGGPDGAGGEDGDESGGGDGPGGGGNSGGAGEKSGPDTEVDPAGVNANCGAGAASAILPAVMLLVGTSRSRRRR